MMAILLSLPLVADVFSETSPRGYKRWVCTERPPPAPLVAVYTLAYTIPLQKTKHSRGASSFLYWSSSPEEMWKKPHPLLFSLKSWDSWIGTIAPLLLYMTLKNIQILPFPSCHASRETHGFSCLTALCPESLWTGIMKEKPQGFSAQCRGRTLSRCLPSTLCADIYTTFHIYIYIYKQKKIESLRERRKLYDGRRLKHKNEDVVKVSVKEQHEKSILKSKSCNLTSLSLKEKHKIRKDWTAFITLFSGAFTYQRVSYSEVQFHKVCQMHQIPKIIMYKV